MILDRENCPYWYIDNMFGARTYYVEAEVVEWVRVTTVWSGLDEMGTHWALGLVSQSEFEQFVVANGSANDEWNDADHTFYHCMDHAAKAGKLLVWFRPDVIHRGG